MDAVELQIRIAVYICVLVAIVRKRLGLEASPTTFDRFSVLLFLRKRPFYGPFKAILTKRTPWRTLTT